MFLKVVNWFTAWFGYRWVVDSRLADGDIVDEMIDDEGWDDLDNNEARYRLEKIDSNLRF